MKPHELAVTTTQLRRFMMLAEELNFTRAARRLHIAQQVLSSQIKQLELEVGTSLFTRSTHHVALTPAGAELLIAAQGALEALDRGVRNALHSARHQTRELRIGFLAHASDLQIVTLRTLRARHPEVTATIRSHVFSDPSNGLLSGETNVALLPHPPKHPDLQVELIREEPRACLLPTGHPLSRHSELRPADFIGLPAIVAEGYDRDPITRAWSDVHTLADWIGERPVGAIVATAQEWLLAAADGRGFTTLPQSAVKYYAYPGIVSVPVADVPPLALCAGWVRGSEDPLVRDFVELMRA
ncbi:LysR family transcriptional regulator [Streptomyces sp. NPDC057199]|uniref:LysR family transcriptional regulator n=1 Tax=Streptomyces sp. NPDC057199 TaxID=3346047 RepID=UPI00362BAE1B